MPKPLFRFLTEIGTGNKNAIGDYSSTIANYSIKPRPNQTLYLRRLIVSLKDVGNMGVNNYGAMPTLPNGINIYYRHENELMSLTDNVPIRTNNDWGRYCYDVKRDSSWSLFGSPGYVLARWSFFKSIGGDFDGTFSPDGLILNGEDGDEFYITLQDDFTGLNTHYFYVNGEREF